MLLSHKYCASSDKTGEVGIMSLCIILPAVMGKDPPKRAPGH